MKNIPNILDLPFTQLNWIESGTFPFQGGAEITFETGFYAGCYQVTQELYQTVMKDKEPPSRFKGKHRPVEQVSWDDAQAFLKELNIRIKLKDGLQFRLPSEAQWEYAARANKDFEYSGSQKLHEVGWFKENANDQTMPVGLKEPNGLGLFDMSGNVWEWCEDDWNKEINDHPKNGQPLKKNKEDIRVFRGGSWSNDEGYARVAVRDGYLHDFRYDNFGFRVFRY